MVAVFRTPRPFRVGCGWFVVLALAGRLLIAPGTQAQGLADDESLFITVRNPITSQEFSRVKAASEAVRQRYREALKSRENQKAPARRLKIVYDFNPDNQTANTVLPGPCQDLAEYIRSVNDAVTIAFVHGEVTRHSVLPVIACHELVMASGDNVRLGNVLPDDAEQLPPDAFYTNPRVLFYQQTAVQRGYSPAIILKMLARDMEVLQGHRADGSICYVDRRRPKESGAVTVGNDPVLPAGAAGFYTPSRAERFGLCKRRLETRQEVAEAYQMPARSLREDVLQGREPVVWTVEARGVLNRLLEERIKRRIDHARGQHANFIILNLACGGGDPVAASALADYLRNLKDNEGRHPVMTVAHLTADAHDNALFVALGCNDIVMDKGAHLGGFEAVADGELLARALEQLAARRDYPPLLVRALIDAKGTVYHVRDTKSGARRFVRGEELAELNRAGRNWEPDGPNPIKEDGKLLVLDAPRAAELGLSRYTVDGPDAIYEKYGLEKTRIHQADGDWFEAFAAFLRNRLVATFVVMIGITCLILALKIPGIGVPEVIAALCFVLFFWAHAQLAFTWLAVLLFLLGLVFIALEIFVMPGVAVLGFSGVAMVLAGLGLATLERWPHTESEWVSTFGNLGQFGLAFLGAVFAAVALARYLPNIPYANRLVLAPPGERGEEAATESPEASPHAALLGAIGVAATTLRPAGMARFGDNFVDVIAEGTYVPPGNRVQVIEVEGYRIVVKEV